MILSRSGTWHRVRRTGSSSGRPVPIVINKDGRIDAAAGQLPRLAKGAFWLVRNSHAFALVGGTQVQSVAPVFVDGVRRQVKVRAKSSFLGTGGAA